MTFAALTGGTGIVIDPGATNLLFVALGLVVLFGFLIAARFAARIASVSSIGSVLCVAAAIEVPSRSKSGSNRSAP